MKKGEFLNDHCVSRSLVHTQQGMRWLSQFDVLDKELAVSIANNLTLVSHIEFERNLIAKIESTAASIPGVVALFAVRELKRDTDGHLIPYYSQVSSLDGKSVNALSDSADQGSEARVAHIVRQLCRFNAAKYLNHPTITAMRESKCDAILFIDDFIGSGRRVDEFMYSFWLESTVVSWLSGKQISFQVVAYSGLNESIQSLSSQKSKPIIHIYRDATTFNNIAWSDGKKANAKKLFIKYGRIANSKRKNMWWGFKEGLAAIIFEHGCPNNTPAILWEPDFSGSGWIGLFPNRTVTNDVASVFPPEIQRGDPIQILTEVGQAKIAKSGALARRGEAGELILLVLALIAKGQRKRSTLSFATGLNVDLIERLVGKCIKWEFITPQRRITPKGLAELDAARKMKPSKTYSLDKGTDYYYPQQLREITNS